MTADDYRQRQIIAKLKNVPVFCVDRPYINLPAPLEAVKKYKFIIKGRQGAEHWVFVWQAGKSFSFDVYDAKCGKIVRLNYDSNIITEQSLEELMVLLEE